MFVQPSMLAVQFYRDLIALHDSSLRIICVLRQIGQEFKEVWHLPDEQTHRGEEADDAHRDAPRLCGSNDRAGRSSLLRNGQGSGMIRLFAGPRRRNLDLEM